MVIYLRKVFQRMLKLSTNISSYLSKWLKGIFFALYIMKLFYKIFEVSESNKTTSVYQLIGFFFSSVTVKNGGWRW